MKIDFFLEALTIDFRYRSGAFSSAYFIREMRDEFVQMSGKTAGLS